MIPPFKKHKIVKGEKSFIVERPNGMFRFVDVPTVREVHHRINIWLKQDKCQHDYVQGRNDCRLCGYIHENMSK